jgi:hypothetical protein
VRSKEIIALCDELLRAQEKKLMQLASARFPHITQEDLLQPVDFPELETDSYFRYEEGVLMGMHTLRSALLTLFQENE